MNNLMYKTKDFNLMPFNEEIFNSIKTNYNLWFFDQEVTKYNSHGLFPQNVEDYKQFFENIKKNKILVLAIAVKENNKLIHIGNISLQSFDWINRSAEFAIIIGEKDYWGKGYATNALQILLYHGFNKLNLHRIWSGTAGVNIGMQKVFEKLGMKKEGIYKDGTFLEGKYEDVVAYGILKKNFDNKIAMDLLNAGRINNT